MESHLLKSLYRTMLRIRMTEEAIAERYSEQQMRCPVHLCIGQEAVAAGVCAALSGHDLVLSNHRCHGHYLACGGDLRAMLAELYGRATGCSGGYGGSMHLVDLKAGFLGSTPIVASTIPIGVGAAFATASPDEGPVTVVFFGEAAGEEGVFCESLNFAALKQLPVVFVCENNLYSVYSPLHVRQPAGRSLELLVKGHGVAYEGADGNDARAVYRCSHEAVQRARRGKGPILLEFQTYRWREHCGPLMDDSLGYRLAGELQSWQERCPLKRLEKDLTGSKILSDRDIDDWKAEIRQELREAFDFSVRSPFPEADSLADGVFARRSREALAGASPADVPRVEDDSEGRCLRFHEAVREALDLALAHDPRVYVMGLGVPDPKGIFGTTLGLQERHGADRVLDMPTSEAAMTGIAIGSALQGRRPVLTHQRVDFALLSMEQIVNQAANWHFMFGGALSVPLVIRMIIGRGWGQGPQHSQSLQAWFAHVPGLKVLMPATAYDAKGLLMGAIEDDNPVIILEHRWLYNLTGPVPEGYYSLPLGKAEVKRQGDDLSIIATSYMTIEALRAARLLQSHGVEAEVVDVRSLRPLDRLTILDSVRKTGRLLVADTGWKSFGVGAELLGLVVEEAFEALKAPPRRVSLPDVSAPTSAFLCRDYYPRAKDIAAAALKMMGLDPSLSTEAVVEPVHLDVPDPSFSGPF